MARPCVSASMSRQKISNEERKRRIENERILRGNNDKLKPPNFLINEGKKIYKWLVNETVEAETFGNIDKFILELFSDTYATWKELSEMYHNEQDFEKREKIDKMKKRYTDQLPRLMNELGLTPSTRAKIGAMNLDKKNEENDPVAQLLREYQKHKTYNF